MPRVSFLMPVRNGARHLRAALDSLLAQDFADYDVVVVDDGSSDATPDILYGCDDPRLVILRTDGRGLVEALNGALPDLDCELIARADADDLSAPGRLTRQVDFLSFTGAAAVSSRSLHVDEAGNVTGLSAFFDVFRADPAALPADEPYLPHPFLLIGRETLERIGGYRHAHLAEDADLSWRLAEEHRIAVDGEPAGRYRLHAGSISNADTAAARVQAHFSQIAALSARRRATGTAEVPYSVTMEDALGAGHYWSTLFALTDPAISDAERDHLRAATVLKFLNLAEWRGHAVSAADIELAEKTLNRVMDVPPKVRERAARIIDTARTGLEAISAQRPRWGVRRS